MPVVLFPLFVSPFPCALILFLRLSSTIFLSLSLSLLIVQATPARCASYPVHSLFTYGLSLRRFSHSFLHTHSLSSALSLSLTLSHSFVCLLVSFISTPPHISFSPYLYISISRYLLHSQAITQPKGRQATLSTFLTDHHTYHVVLLRTPFIPFSLPLSLSIASVLLCVRITMLSQPLVSSRFWI